MHSFPKMWTNYEQIVKFLIILKCEQIINKCERIVNFVNNLNCEQTINN